MCRINKDCDPELNVNCRVSVPPAEWLEACKSVRAIQMVDEALQSLFVQAEKHCSEIRPPRIEAICNTGQPIYDEYDDCGEGIGEPTGTTGPQMGFFLFTAGTSLQGDAPVNPKDSLK